MTDPYFWEDSKETRSSSTAENPYLDVKVLQRDNLGSSALGWKAQDRLPAPTRTSASRYAEGGDCRTVESRLSRPIWWRHSFQRN
jgi:hypothetical protein